MWLFYFYIFILVHLTTVDSTVRRQHHKPPGDYVGFRISGGTDTEISMFPYVGSVILKVHDKQNIEEVLMCSAVIIDTYFVLTAGSCFRDIDLQEKDTGNGQLVIRANTTVWTGNTESTEDHQIVNYHIFHNVSSRRAGYLWHPDLAIFKVKEPFTGLNEKPIPLAPKDYEYEVTTSAVICGWGASEEDPYYPSPQLKNATMGIANTERCQTFLDGMYDDSIDENYMVCTYDNLQSLCEFATGGPLVQNGFLIGIAASNEKLCTDVPNYPIIFTKISVLNDLIVKYVKTL